MDTESGEANAVCSDEHEAFCAYDRNEVEFSVVLGPNSSGVFHDIWAVNVRRKNDGEFLGGVVMTNSGERGRERRTIAVDAGDGPIVAVTALHKSSGFFTDRGGWTFGAKGRKWGELGREKEGERDGIGRIENFPPEGTTIKKVACGWGNYVVGVVDKDLGGLGGELGERYLRLFGWGRNDRNQLGNSSEEARVERPIELTFGGRFENMNIENFGVLAESIVVVAVSESKAKVGGGNAIDEWRHSIPPRQLVFAAGWGDHGNCGGEKEGRANLRLVGGVGDDGGEVSGEGEGGEERNWEGSQRRRYDNIAAGGAHFIRY